MYFSLAVPGAVIDLSHVLNDKIALTWRPPQTDDSTIIFYYVIDWTISNKTFSANVTADKLYFEVKFHEITASTYLITLHIILVSRYATQR